MSDLISGFNLVGQLDLCGEFHAQPSEPAAMMEDLTNAAKWSQQAVIGHLRGMGQVLERSNSAWSTEEEDAERPIHQ